MMNSTCEGTLATLFLDRTVLIVEDEEGILNTVAGYLEANGVAVICARNGTEALARVAGGSTRLAVVITDMIMPDMDGLVLAQELQARGYGGGYIFMSGANARQIYSVAEAEPRKRFLQKPFRLAALGALIREVTGGGVIDVRK